MIDAEKVKRFWEERASRYGKLEWESLANLEQDAEKLQLKIRDETAKVFSWLPNLEGTSILDLGAGVGQWSLRFAERGARRVLAVEYVADLVRIAQEQAKQRGLTNIEFRVEAVEDFDTQEKFDLLFVSGLFLYLNDDQLEALAGKLARFVAENGLLVVRDSIGVQGRHEIIDRYSEGLGVNYSAIYRTRESYVRTMARAGLSLSRSENVFPEGHPLNKFPETRLHLFIFTR